ncbi:MAG: aminotransferase class V-fold PLP-dependent enzyme, partial [Dehalococcoidia bacterium]|nr:aminotransferase class V-fold PLP-dependent enzyme [Dehalococcoidia bacterium]
MDEQTRVAAARARLPAVTTSVYLNAGTNGPIPECCYEAMRAFQYDEWMNGRAGLAMLDKMTRVREEIRAALGAYLNAPPETIAVTASTTHGMGLATFSFDWRPGDEIVTTDVEHPGGLLPGYYAERQFGARVRFAAIGTRAGDVTDAIAAQVTPRTKLVSVSHVIWSTGAVIDIAALSAFCRDRGLPLLVDGAQSVGAIPVDVTALDVDFYAFPGQKWLLGPSATGGLY